MKSDCAAREGRLEYTVTDVTPVPAYTIEGVCTSGAGDPFYDQFFYGPVVVDSKAGVRDYVAYMKTDCRTRKGSLTYTVS